MNICCLYGGWLVGARAANICILICGVVALCVVLEMVFFILLWRLHVHIGLKPQSKRTQ